MPGHLPFRRRSKEELLVQMGDRLTRAPLYRQMPVKVSPVDDPSGRQNHAGHIRPSAEVPLVSQRTCVEANRSGGSDGSKGGRIEAP